MNRSEILKEKVLFLLDAINCEDFESARECLEDNFRFQEFLFSYTGSQLYLERIEKMDMKFKIRKIFADEENVCVVYDMTINSNNEMAGCGLYGFNNKKIVSLELFSDHFPIRVFSKNGDHQQNN